MNTIKLITQRTALISAVCALAGCATATTNGNSAPRASVIGQDSMATRPLIEVRRAGRVGDTLLVTSGEQSTSVRVVNVLPDGNLLVATQGVAGVRYTGVVNPVFITRPNKVSARYVQVNSGEMQARHNVESAQVQALADAGSTEFSIER